MTPNLLSNGNIKLKRDGIFHFSIPAFQSADGSVTCPGAKDCAKGCYARQGFHGMSWVKNANEKRFAATLEDDFAQRITNEIQRRKISILRVHDSGDFYSKQYLWQWIRVFVTFPHVKFYAYTKMIPLFKASLEFRPPNFKVIYSFGGKWDGLIDLDKDHHAVVFRTHEDLARAGYADATKSDLVALENRKVGLVYHGGKNLIWGKDGIAETSAQTL